MTRRGAPHGDTHNFGRSVSLVGKRVVKPRSVSWEWLMLGKDSPLRSLLDGLATSEWSEPEAFGFLPRLRFFPTAGPGGGGAVEKIELKPLGVLPREKKTKLAAITGRSLAFWSWFGVSDLHWENLVLGVDKRGQIVLSPVDIEMILADLARPTETKLLPDADPEYAEVCRHAAGLRRVLPFLGKPIQPTDLVTMVDAYLAMLAFLDNHAKAIATVFRQLPGLKATPVRVCLRGTDEYVRARSVPPWPPLLKEELEQLERGDIPYFFRLYGRQGIFFYADEELTTLKRLPLRGDVPQLDPMLNLANGLAGPSRRALRDEGIFTIIGAFDDPSFKGSVAFKDVAVAFRARSLVVSLPSGQQLEATRNLRAFVGSVYLPCTCGEVRSVFVPKVTVCKGSARA